MIMELREAIKKRRSVRRFLSQPVEEDKLMKVIEAGMWAPSACNMQSWKFVVIDKEEIKHQLADWGAAAFIRYAPLAIIVLYDNRTANVEYHDHIQSAAAGIENMLLTATALGLGTCWVAQLPAKERVRQLLKIPRVYDPVACIVMGYPAVDPKPVDRKEFPETAVSYNEFSGKAGKQNILKIMAKRILLKVFYWVPVRIKKKINNLVDKHFVKKFPE